MGKVILIGGKVDIGTEFSMKEKKELVKPKHFRMVKPEILERFLHEMKGKSSRIELLTSASAIPFAIGYEYRRAFRSLGCKDIGIMHFRKGTEADKAVMLKRLRECDGILLCGGSQEQLCKVLHNTKFLTLLRSRYKKEREFLVAGTSAGAMALGREVIAQESRTELFLKGHVRMIKGLDLLPKIIVDTHFVQRRRLSRLIQAVANYPSKLGIGLSENTAVFFKTPGKVEVIGNNLVVLIDGSHITYNNIRQIKKNHKICLENVKLHVLPKGHVFNIPKRKILV
jgi:cyanophycinase